VFLVYLSLQQSCWGGLCR